MALRVNPVVNFTSPPSTPAVGNRGGNQELHFPERIAAAVSNTIVGAASAISSAVQYYIFGYTPTSSSTDRAATQVKPVAVNRLDGPGQVVQGMQVPPKERPLATRLGRREVEASCAVINATSTLQAYAVNPNNLDQMLANIFGEGSAASNPNRLLLSEWKATCAGENTFGDPNTFSRPDLTSPFFSLALKKDALEFCVKKNPSLIAGFMRDNLITDPFNDFNPHSNTPCDEISGAQLSDSGVLDLLRSPEMASRFGTVEGNPHAGVVFILNQFGAALPTSTPLTDSTTYLGLVDILTPAQRRITAQYLLSQGACDIMPYSGLNHSLVGQGSGDASGGQGSGDASGIAACNASVTMGDVLSIPRLEMRITEGNFSQLVSTDTYGVQRTIDVVTLYKSVYPFATPSEVKSGVLGFVDYYTDVCLGEATFNFYGALQNATGGVSDFPKVAEILNSNAGAIKPVMEELITSVRAYNFTLTGLTDAELSRVQVGSSIGNLTSADAELVVKMLQNLEVALPKLLESTSTPTPTPTPTTTPTPTPTTTPTPTPPIAEQSSSGAADSPGVKAAIALATITLAFFIFKMIYKKYDSRNHGAYDPVVRSNDRILDDLGAKVESLDSLVRALGSGHNAWDHYNSANYPIGSSVAEYTFTDTVSPNGNSGEMRRVRRDSKYLTSSSPVRGWSDPEYIDMSLFQETSLATPGEGASVPRAAQLPVHQDGGYIAIGSPLGIGSFDDALDPNVLDETSFNGRPSQEPQDGALGRGVLKETSV